MKELIVVLGIALVTFLFAKSTALRFTTELDFRRRRNVWLLLTIVSFLSPNFWLYALIAAPTLAWAGRKDENPIALYLFVLFVVPPVSVEIPAIGVNEIFSLDNYRLLSFCVLIPAAFRARRSIEPASSAGNGSTDYWLLAFGAVQVALFVEPDVAHTHIIYHDSFTNLLRRVFLFTVDVLVGYYAISRSCTDRRRILEAQSAFCLATLVMAQIAMFEHIRRWLMYQALAFRWHPSDANYLLSWLFRDSGLRGQASSGHPLVLGFLLALAFGFWIFLQSYAKTMSSRLIPIAIYWCGLFATFSRGAWVGALTIYLFQSAVKPRAMSRLLRGLSVIIIAAGVLSLTSTGERIISSLPFLGGSADSSFTYRQRLVQRSVVLIKAHPFFGDQHALSKMEDLRQGQGIIDIVNVYVGVALFNGLVGFGLFAGLIVSALLSVYRSARHALPNDAELGYSGLNLLACMFGVLLMIANVSLMYGVQIMLYVVIALAVGYTRCVRSTVDGARKAGQVRVGRC